MTSEVETLFRPTRLLAGIMRLGADGYQVGQEINMIQVGSDPLALEFIKQGKIAFTLDLQPYLQAYPGAVAYAHLKDGFTPSDASFSIAPVIITQESAANMPVVKLSAGLLENLQSEGMLEEILQDLQSMEKKSSLIFSLSEP